MDIEPQIVQETQNDGVNKTIQEPGANKDSNEEKPNQTGQQQKKFVDEVRIGDQTIFTIPPEMQYQQNNLVYRERKTRWGERQIKRSKIQEDAVFNPLEALYSGTSLLPITQYGQSEIEVKLQLYSTGRKRKSKWHHEIQKTFTPPMLNYISPNIGLDEVQYLLRLYRLDQLTAKLNDFTPDDPDIRSPSPEPIYDKDGRRINTREIRKRDALHRQRISLIEDCMKMKSTFVPPEDYKPLKKYKKIYLTETAINDTKANYIGKIIGPEGKTQKLIERRTKCKIAVRGRGANKKQKDIFQNYQPLHIIIVADTDEDLDKGVQDVHNILNGEEDDEIKELLESYNQVVLGILDDNYCDNCQQQGHRTWACPFYDLNKSKKANVRCEICNQTTHPTSDCPDRQAYLQRQQTENINRLIESQYEQFRSDLNSDLKGTGGLKFLTDNRVDMFAIQGIKNANEQNKHVPSTAKATSADKKVKMPEQMIIGGDMPKFEDDD